MRNSGSRILRAAMLACFGTVAGQAGAVVNLSIATPTGTAKVASEIPANTTTLVNSANQLDIKVAVPRNYTVSAGSPLFIKINLTNGARFVANPTSLRCATAAAANSLSGQLVVGGAGNSFVTYSIEPGTVSGTCSATNGNLTISGLSNVTVSATIEYKNGVQDVVSGLSFPYVTFTRGMTASVTSADGNVTVDATRGSTLLASTSNKGSTTLATLGFARYRQNGTSAASAGLANNVSAGDVLTTAAVTVNGPALRAGLEANGVSGVFLDAAASACTTRSYTVGSTATNAVTFTNVSLTDISAGVWICLNVSGATSVITTGQLTATLSGTPVASVTSDFSAPSDALEPVISNGAISNAYMVNASTSPAKTSIIRIVNTGGVAAAFTATAYAVDVGVADGAPVAQTVLGTANSALGTIAAGGAVSLTSAQLEEKLGFTPGAPGSKYRIVISAGTDSMVILNYTRDVATGAVVLSQSQAN